MKYDNCFKLTQDGYMKKPLQLKGAHLLFAVSWLLYFWLKTNEQAKENTMVDYTASFYLLGEFKAFI